MRKFDIDMDDKEFEKILSNDEKAQEIVKRFKERHAKNGEKDEIAERKEGRSPDYYSRGGMDVWDILEKKMTNEEYKGFLKGNIIKYILRAGHKPRNSEFNDVCKAYDYVARLRMVADMRLPE